MVAPILGEVASDMSDKLTVGKVDVDENQKLLGQLAYEHSYVGSIQRWRGSWSGDGALSKSQLLSFLEQHL